jgi:hypothetical protein
MRSISKQLAQSLVLSSALFASAVGGVAHASTGDPSQWGARAEAATAKVNEYEGQHFAGGRDPEVPVITGRKVNEYEGQHLGYGGSKNGDVPVVSGRAATGGSGGTGDVVIISG